MNLTVSTDAMNWIVSGIIMVVFLGLAFGSRYLLKGIIWAFARRTKTTLDDLLINSLSLPFFIGLILAGIWVVLNRTHIDLEHPVIHSLFVSAYILLISLAAIRVLSAILTWYGTEIAVRTKTDLDDKLLPLVRRVVIVVILVLAVMFILQTFGVEIAPLLAGLGIGGLAVALALQPTLSNFLAGTYVLSDAVIHTGDYLLLDSGHEGYVEEIGWRTTKIRTWEGNLLLMPNSKLSDAIIIDYEQSEKSMQFRVDCGVSYDSDLEKVERVTLEVAREVLQRLPEGAKNFEPLVRFKQFGDSNIVFATVLKSQNRLGYYVVKHEFIKALHKRFQKEGIEIQYPVSKVYFANKLGVEYSDLERNGFNVSSSGKG